MPLDGATIPGGTPALDKIEVVIAILADERKWCKHSLRAGDGRLCIMGAVHEVRGAGLLHDPILRVMREVTGRRYFFVERFNDDPATTPADVCRALHRARQMVVACAAPRAAGWRRIRGLLQVHGRPTPLPQAR